MRARAAERDAIGSFIDQSYAAHAFRTKFKKAMLASILHLHALLEIDIVFSFKVYH